MKKNAIKDEIIKLNQHISNLHNRLMQVELTLSYYIEMRGYGKKLQKFVDKKVAEKKEDEQKE